LEGLEQRQEGLALGVRDVLKRARTVNAAPWNQVVACVGDLLDVPLEHAALLEVALGPRAQLIVTRDLDGLSDYLNSGEGLFQGRVGFIQPATHATLLPEDRGSLPDLSGRPGIVTRADRLATEPDHVRGLAAQLLADTWIVESLNDARAYAVEFALCRFVTLQGELLEPGDVLHAGLTPQETSVVSRRSELRSLRVELRRLDEEIADQVRELTSLVKTLTSVDSEFAEAEADRQAAARIHDESRVLQTAQQREVDRLRQLQQRSEREQAELVERIRNLDEEK